MLSSVSVMFPMRKISINQDIPIFSPLEGNPSHLSKVNKELMEKLKREFSMAGALRYGGGKSSTGLPVRVFKFLVLRLLTNDKFRPFVLETSLQVINLGLLDSSFLKTRGTDLVGQACETTQVRFHGRNIKGGNPRSLTIISEAGGKALEVVPAGDIGIGV